MTLHRTLVILILCAGVATSITAVAQSSREQNVRAIKPYLIPRPISILEWELLQFNLLWQGSFVGNVNYLTSFPVMFDQKAMRFRATFSVQDKREHNDPELFFRLPKPQRESIFQGAIDQLIEHLAQSFPEIKSNRGMLYAEFWFRSPSGGRSVVARYENGMLSYSE